MPVYTYRREDGSTFDIRQKFSDDPLTVDPETGQRVVRVVQAAGIVFKGSGFYITDSKGAARTSVTANGNGNGKKADGEGKSPSEAAAPPATKEVSAAAD